MIEAYNIYFVISKQDVVKLTEERFDVLSNIAHNKEIELHNPVFLD